MSTYQFDPLVDERWRTLVESHPSATSFHHPGWLRALRQTYGYETIVITTAAPDEALRDGLLLGLVRSSVTGWRLVSVPFADHCAPLAEDPETLAALLGSARDLARKKRCRFAEFRPLSPLTAETAAAAGAGPSFKSNLHQIDIAPTEDELLKACSETAVRQNIRKAQRKNLRYEAGVSDRLLDDFFSLMVMTRRKHKLPPQPRAWFRSLLDELPGIAKIHLTYLDDIPTAAIFTTVFGRRSIYKYGASNPAYMNLGGTPFLIWRAIQEAKAAGCAWFDMGRTDFGNEGLTTFKERWNAQATPLEYYRSPAPSHTDIGRDKGLVKLAEPIFARLPDKLLIAAGKYLYRHMG